VTFPIWGWFRKGLKTRWLAQQPKRYEDIDVESISNPFDQKSWMIEGLRWGALMFLIMSIVFPYFDGESITWKTLLLGLIIWTIGGLGFGYSMKLFMNWKVSTEAGESA
jgi:hypothetical protein